jgi:hypothetical protein
LATFTEWRDNLQFDDAKRRKMRDDDGCPFPTTHPAEDDCRCALGFP